MKFLKITAKKNKKPMKLVSEKRNPSTKKELDLGRWERIHIKSTRKIQKKQKRYLSDGGEALDR
jgi:hypothetical protein